MTYCIIIDTDIRCDFQITGILRDGNTKFTIQDVVNAHQDWQEETQQVLGVTITETIISYAVGESVKGTLESIADPGFVISGDVNVLCESRGKYVTFLVVKSLAAFIAEALMQYRVHVFYSGTPYLLEMQY